MMKKTFLSLSLMFTYGFADCPLEQNGYSVSAYYENWSQYRPAVGSRNVFFPNMIDPSILTDLNFAFGLFGFVTKSINPNNPHLTGDYTVQPIEWNDQSTLYPQFKALKDQTSGKLRLWLSLGGWTFNDPNDSNIGKYTYQLYSEMVSTQANRKQFIDSAISYAHQYNFDGIDLDWEYPGDTTRGGSDADLDNFVSLLSECSSAFQAANPSLLLSIVGPATVPAGMSQKYHDQPDLYYQWLAKCAQYVDHINLMAYDYHGSFDNPQITGVNAPLKQDTDPKSNLYIVKTLNNYIQNGVPANKIVLGMPTYGRSFGGVQGLTSSDNGPGKAFTCAGAAGPGTQQAGLLAYFEICDMVSESTLTRASDATTNTAYGYNISNQEWVSFDTPDTIELKVKEITDLSLKGAMFWAVDTDEYQWSPTYPNIRKAYNLLNNY